LWENSTIVHVKYTNHGSSDPAISFFLTTLTSAAASILFARNVILKLYARLKAHHCNCTIPHPEAIHSPNMSRSIKHLYYAQPIDRTELSVGLDMHLPCRYAMYKTMKASSPHQPNTDKRSSPSPDRAAKSSSQPRTPSPKTTAESSSPPPRRPGVIYGKSFDKYGVVKVEELWVAAEVKQLIEKEAKGAVRRIVERVRVLGRRVDGERKMGRKGRGKGEKRGL